MVKRNSWVVSVTDEMLRDTDQLLNWLALESRAKKPRAHKAVFSSRRRPSVVFLHDVVVVVVAVLSEGASSSSASVGDKDCNVVDCVDHHERHRGLKSR